MKVERALPNILITGTPGVGKTTLARTLVSNDRIGRLGLGRFRLINLGEAIEAHKLYKEWDDKLNASIFSKSLVKGYLKPYFSNRNGGIILDFHSAGFLYASWFDLVIVLRARTETLFDRLKARGYPSEKITQNVESEIFQVVYDEAVEAFGDTVELWVENNDEPEQLNRIQEKIFMHLGA